MTDETHIARTCAAAMRAGKPYRKRSAETWNLIRTAYLRGATASALAERYDVSHGNIMRRAREEGWTRRAFAETADRAFLDAAPPPEAGPSPRIGGPAPLVAPGPEDEPPLEQEAANTTEAAVRLTLAAVSRCLKAGRYAEAERLGKLAETLSRVQPAMPPFSYFLDKARADTERQDRAREDRARAQRP